MFVLSIVYYDAIKNSVKATGYSQLKEYQEEVVKAYLSGSGKSVLLEVAKNMFHLNSAECM